VNTSPNKLNPPTEHRPYIGRFAPSPSGGLHFGSLVTALGSFLDAKAQQGEWLVRIDNIDPPREKHGAISEILHSLEAFSLHWDQSVIYQSQRIPHYLDICIQLINEDLVYPCTCSRKDLALYKQYPGNCRKLLSSQEKRTLIDTLKEEKVRFSDRLPSDTIHLHHKEFSLRLRTQNIKLEDTSSLNFIDNIQGKQSCPEDFGDFVILRKDGLPSYMLACALDDMQDSISHLVRGCDLLEATFWQRYLQRHIASLPWYQQRYEQPQHHASIHYSHLPVILNSQNQKLSKQHHAKEIDVNQRTQLLFLALKALGQEPDPTLVHEKHDDLLQWAIANWTHSEIPKRNQYFKTLQNSTSCSK